METLLCKAQIIDEIRKTTVDQELSGCGGGEGGAEMKDLLIQAGKCPREKESTVLPEITEFKCRIFSPFVCSGQIFQQAGNNLELVDEQGWSEALKAHLMLPGIDSQATIKQHENCFYLNPYMLF